MDQTCLLFCRRFHAICIPCVEYCMFSQRCAVGLKVYANGRNKSQHSCVLLGFLANVHCCVRLHGSKSLTGFKLHTTSANKCQHCFGSMQTDATCLAQQCCLLLANNVASVCMGLKTLYVYPLPLTGSVLNFE